MPLFTLQQMAAPAAQLALTLHARGESVDCNELVPFYLRPSQAEREYARKEAQESRDQ
jgi:tRNA A37 threonylcarbamoyladenosine modification protein TsaB